MVQDNRCPNSNAVRALGTGTSTACLHLTAIDIGNEAETATQAPRHCDVHGLRHAPRHGRASCNFAVADTLRKRNINSREFGGRGRVYSATNRDAERIAPETESARARARAYESTWCTERGFGPLDDPLDQDVAHSEFFSSLKMPFLSRYGLPTTWCASDDVPVVIAVLWLTDNEMGSRAVEDISAERVERYREFMGVEKVTPMWYAVDECGVRR